MFKNYLKIAFRNILRHKAYAGLNIAGLAIGMACSIFILLWVQDELSYDRFHANAAQLYRLTCSAGDFKAAVSAAGMAEGLQSDMPEIKAAVRLSKPSTNLLSTDEKRFEEKHVFYADSNFLQVFSFPLVKGNARTALSKPDMILITEQMAKKYFGDEEPIGKFIRKDNNENLMVTGVFKEIPSNSHLQFDFIIPMSNLARRDSDLKNKIWGSFNFYTYIQFNRSVNDKIIPDLIQKIEQIYINRGKAKAKIDFHLQPITDIHLNSNLQIDLPGRGNEQYVKVFFVVALFILAVACINFMNLATARSARRAKEVGLRKVIGATRNQLIVQFLGESLIISFLSLIIAIGIVYALLPLFNSLSEKTLAIHLFDGKLFMNLFVIALIAGIISGSYPALFLSGFRPVKVLKGSLKLGTGNLLFRNGLVVTQFVVSIMLLIGTAVVYKQLNFIKNKNLGFDKSNLIYIPMTSEIWGKQKALKGELLQNSLTENFSIISDLPTTLISGTIDVDWEGKDPNSQVVIPSMDIDENFVDVFKSQILSGRNFSKEFKGDSNNFIVNEKAMQLMGMKKENIVGKSLRFGSIKGTIIGVVKDFNYKPLQYAIEPLVLRPNKYGGIVVVRTLPGKTEATIEVLEKIYTRLNPAYPFAFNFLDKDLDNLYKGERQMGQIFNLFAVLAIFISCLGLYGLSAFMAEQQTKEIGVRKVLGATVFNIVYLLSQNFTKLILIAVAIAIPVSWIAVNNWLNDFAYRIDVGWTVFVTVSLAALFIAWFTVSYESIKAAIANPIKSLRSE